jgi:hypothetical protein
LATTIALLVAVILTGKEKDVTLEVSAVMTGVVMKKPPHCALSFK